MDNSRRINIRGHSLLVRDGLANCAYCWATFDEVAAINLLVPWCRRPTSNRLDEDAGGA